jgi:ethanolamine transporter EutH
MNFVDLKAANLDGKSFVESCWYFKDHFSVSLVIGAIATLFSAIAGFDYINDNKYGYRDKYYAAWEAMAPMAGITCLVPVIRLFLTPIISPIFRWP